jgi:ribosomal-protein-alanine N-acetyltransferase
LGYFLLPDYWGKGYATEAAKAVIRFAFGSCGVHKLTASCLMENIASERVMIKSGLQKEAVRRSHQWHDGGWKDRVEYGIVFEKR